MNDERNREDTLTSVALQEALGNVPLSIMLECEASPPNSQVSTKSGQVHPSVGSCHLDDTGYAATTGRQTLQGL